MAKRIDTQARNEAIRLQDQGSPPAAPAAGYSLVFTKADGLYLETTAGAVIGPFITGSASTLQSRVLLETLTTTGTSSFSFSSPITAIYNHLEIEYVARSTVGATVDTLLLYFNDDTTATNYRYSRTLVYAAGTELNGGGDGAQIGEIAGATSVAGSVGVGKIHIPFYAGSTWKKMAHSNVTHRSDASSVHVVRAIYGFEWENTAAITKITIVITGALADGSKFLLYGAY